MKLHPIFDKTHLRLGGCIALSSLLLFVGLGSFGIWEPHEINYTERAEKILAGTPLNDHGTHIEERMAAAGWSLIGRSELGARLPVALLALVAVIVLFLLLHPLASPRQVLLATLFFAGSPLLLYNGRQLSGGMPPLMADILALGGLSLVLFGRSRAASAAGGLSALLGLGLGLVSRGALIGVASPLLVVALSLLFSGHGGSFFTPDGTAGRRRGIAALVTGVTALLVAGGYLAVALSKSDMVFITGGALKPTNYKMTFDFPLEQIAYSWFPWSALVPISVLGYFTTDTGDRRTLYLRALSITGILIGYLSQAVSLELIGVTPTAVVVPMALGAAFAVDDMLTAEHPMRLMVFLGVAMFALMLRDFFQNPETLLYGLGFEGVPIPEKDYKPIIRVGFFALPAGLLIATGFLAAGSWRRWQFRVLTLLAPLVFGAGLSFYLVPYYSVHLSAKHAVEAYQKYRTGDEPLGVFGSGQFLSDAKELSTRKETVAWLSRKDRVFALFPPKHLPDLDQMTREKTGHHLFVLDAESDRFAVATSKLLPKEKNRNPLIGFTSSKPFVPGPSHPMTVNFDDKLTFLGWRLESDGAADRLVQGKEMVFTSYWRVDKKVNGDFKFFMHIDGPGGRIHGDHEPFDNKFPTSKWAEGDYIREAYRMKIPLYQASGDYSIRMGLYRGSGRMTIKDDSKAKDNAIQVAEIMLD